MAAIQSRYSELDKSRSSQQTGAAARLQLMFLAAAEVNRCSGLILAVDKYAIQNQSQQQLAATATERDELREQLEQTTKERDDLVELNQALTTELSRLKETQSAQTSQQLPNLEAVRDRILASLKLGKQAPGYKALAKSLNQFIDELRGEH